MATVTHIGSDWDVAMESMRRDRCMTYIVQVKRTGNGHILDVEKETEVLRETLMCLNDGL